MRSVPPGWPEVIPGLPLLFVFVGAPDSYQHAQRECELGHSNHVAVKDIQHAMLFCWPTVGLSVIVILFVPCEKKEEKEFVAMLLADDPIEVLVRYWPDITVARHTP